MASAFVSKLAESGLTPKDAKLQGLTLLSPTQLKKLAPTAPEAEALLIPYHTAEGKVRSGIFRARLLGKPPWAEEWKNKFRQGLDSPPAAFFPKGIDWKEFFDDPKKRLILTEGEMKSLCACKLGLITIGLGGIWNWGDKKRSWTLLPELEPVVWIDREVLIVADSDGAIKPLVQLGAYQLAASLRQRGAHPKILILPPRVGSTKKVGLDDFLVAAGKDAVGAFEKLAEPLEGEPLTEAMWAMSTRYAYIVASDTLYDEKLHIMLNPHSAFTTTLANNRIPLCKPDGTKYSVSVPKNWFEWKLRRDFERFTYAPGKGVDVDGRYNLWPGWGVEEKEGDVGPWTALLDFVLSNLTAEERLWFERWCAYPIQNPGAKLDSAVCIWSRAQRIGKSFIALILGDVYGHLPERANFAEIQQIEFESGFTSWGKHRQFILVDDVNTITRTSAKDHAARLKTLITQESFKINIKHIANYTLPDTINYMLTSNRPDALLLDEKDCRFMVVQAPDVPKPLAWYARVDRWRKSGGPAALLYHLRRLPMGDFNARTHPPRTEAKADMHRLAQADHQTWAEELFACPNAILKGDVRAAKWGDLFRTSELLSIFSLKNETGRIAVNTMGASLASAGFNARVVRVDGDPMRLIPVRNREKWESKPASEWASHYIKHAEGRT
jgi:hypothetical protein